MKTFFKIVGIISLFTLMSCEQTVHKNKRRIKAVPKSAFVIYEAEEMGSAFDELHDNSLWQIIEKESNVKLVVDQLKSLNDFLKNNKISVERDKVLMSLHKTGSKSFDFLVYLYADDVDVASINTFSKYKVSTKKYDNADIDKYSLPGVSIPFYVSNYKGIFILSRSIILIEKSVRQLNSGVSLMDYENFKSLYNSINPKEDFNVLINMSKLSSLSTWVSQKDVLTWGSNFSDWMEVDVSPETNEVFLSGITSVNDSIGHYLGVFNNLDATKITVDELLPSATSFSVSYGIESFPKYYRSYMEYLRMHGKLQKFELTQKSYKISRSDLFDSWVDDQFTIASIKSNSTNVNYNDLVLIKSRDEALAIDALQLVSDKSVIDFRSYAIRKFDKKNVLKSYLGSNFDKIAMPYYTVIDDVVVLSDNLKIVKDVVSDYLDGRCLSNYNHFKNIKEDLSSKSSILFYFKNPDFAETLIAIFPDLKKVISNNIKALAKYKSGAVQFSYDNGIAFTNVLLEESVEEENEVKPLWELDFDAELYQEIYTLYNHKTKSKELAVQDKNNVLYLVSNSGKILWKKELDSKILGEIQQVDLYKNKKFQMVFNTEKYLYLIDRNGNKVESYPKKLRWKATAPVGVFDYSKIRDYRFLVPMGKHLVMYNGKGQVVKGFAPKKIIGTIDKAPQHFRVKGKDYIVASTSAGRIYILDRRGNYKIKISKKYPLGCNNFFLSEGSTLKTSSFVTTTKKGELLSIFLNGTVDAIEIEEFDENTFYKVIGEETVSLSSRELKWGNKNSAGVTDVEGGDFSSPQLFKKGDLSFIMFGSKAINKVFLFDADMNLEKGFPIYGQTVGVPADYNKNGVIDFPVIVNQGKGNLKMYSVN
jgi:hypothetical protein